MNDLDIEIALDIDEEGMVLVECPECIKEFKTPSTTINNDDTIICSHCKQELLYFNFTKKDRDRIQKIATEQAIGYATDRLNRTIKKINRQLK